MGSCDSKVSRVALAFVLVMGGADPVWGEGGGAEGGASAAGGAVRETRGSSPASGEGEESAAAPVARPNERLPLAVRFAVERVHIGWKRSYEGKLSLDTRSVEFFGSEYEETWGTRGRVEVLMGADGAGIRGKLGPWVEVSDPRSHFVEIAGSSFRFETAPILVGVNGGLEVRFARERGFVGVGVGLANVFENIHAERGVVNGVSTHFSLLGSGTLGFRIPVSSVIVLGALLSAEYHAFVASTRLSGGLFFEVLPW